MIGLTLQNRRWFRCLPIIKVLPFTKQEVGITGLRYLRKMEPLVILRKVVSQASKGTPIHMQVLFNVLMGLQRQEINGLKYSDVDYINRTLSVERQLGKELNRNPDEGEDKPMTKRELPLKSSSSKRVLPIPDYVFEAILEERKMYERNRSRRRSQF